MKIFISGLLLAGVVLASFQVLTSQSASKRLTRVYTPPRALPPDPTPSYHMVAYVLGDHPIDVGKIQPQRITHINYAFADVKNNEVKSFLRDDEANLKALTALRDSFPHLKILVSLGGWTRSKGFHQAALTEANRKSFAKSAVAFLEKHRLDGIDIDWEYPGLRGGGNPHGPEDRENFTLMLTELRKQLDDHALAEERDPTRPYLLTIATGVGPEHIENMELDKLHHAIDYINLMTYDFAGGWSKVTAHHTNLYRSEHARERDVDAATIVENFHAAGVPKNKLVLGAAFFGRGWVKVKRKNQGLRQPAGNSSGSIAYHSLEAKFIEKRGYQRIWDDRAKAPFLWNGFRGSFISYEDSLSLAYKAQFVKEEALAGIMFWEYYRDTTGVLLNSLYTELKHPRAVFAEK